jgi:hypothetical protein
MASAWSKGLFDETLGSDPNGNQLNWNNQINPPPQPGFNSLGSYQQPGQSFQMPQWGPWGAVANNISGSKSYGFAPQPQTTPGKTWMSPTQPQQNSFGSWNPQTPNPAWNKPAPQKLQSVSDFKKDMNAKQAQADPNRSRTAGQVTQIGYADPNRGRSSGQMTQAGATNRNLASRTAVTNPYDLRLQPYYRGRGSQQSTLTNPLLITAQQSIPAYYAYNAFWAAKNSLNKPATPPASSGGGGYGYGDWGYGYGGGGGYTQRKYAENLPGAVWRMNQ